MNGARRLPQDPQESLLCVCVVCVGGCGGGEPSLTLSPHASDPNADGTIVSWGRWAWAKGAEETEPALQHISPFVIITA